ncbi:putative Vacuolar carboxypeptidase Cps1 [Trichophyton interdigitale]|uniref:Vacuolar carboxypeptidase Cps1 n=1 Tax=Trichophyton interdigitale TaxID=101480 RepID=A0A9P4YGC6_9EURO|nr:putative Vacuolar carboxypeptidase Cps1 [Trichophyton interdigitale]KAF3893668.1 putative Vacuolar carboxypeptidase Cps1 [Trichophyton interdigitale]KAG8207050.1 putative Vacuolar carboxypeptidase Cps1 [Trichophyton interdigitale]
MEEDQAAKLRSQLRLQVSDRREAIIQAAQKLVAAPSPCPPGNTTLAAAVAIQLLKEAIPGIQITHHITDAGIMNVVACISSGRPGKRLVFNGHLDTFPLGEDLKWTVPLTGGVIKDGRLYGRGISDMKGGIAASIVAATILSENRDAWSGEIVLTLAGDEESMGKQGTKWLLDNVEKATGDAMICGDAGSPRVIRFGEKGFVWVDIEAVGTPAHGAHVHRGVNAIDRLRKALDEVCELERAPINAPQEVSDAIDAARDISESLSGAGESNTLQRITVNTGTIKGGVSPNLIPSSAMAQCDIRIPVGVSTDFIEKRLKEVLEPMAGISWRILRTSEPNYTSPNEEICRLTEMVSTEVLGQKAVCNMRVGASDSRWYRAANVPTVVVGCTPNNMGAADEYVEIDELVNISQIHTIVAYEFLKNNA